MWCECVTQRPPSTAPCMAADRPEPTPSEEGAGPESLHGNNNAGTESTPSSSRTVSTEPLHHDDDVGLEPVPDDDAGTEPSPGDAAGPDSLHDDATQSPCASDNDDTTTQCLCGHDVAQSPHVSGAYNEATLLTRQRCGHTCPV